MEETSAGRLLLKISTLSTTYLQQGPKIQNMAKI